MSTPSKPMGSILTARWIADGTVIASIRQENGIGHHSSFDPTNMDEMTSTIGRIVAHAIEDGVTHIKMGEGSQLLKMR